MPSIKYNVLMKKLNFITIVISSLLTFNLSSCDTLSSMHETGIGFGIFVVISIVFILGIILMKMLKTRSKTDVESTWKSYLSNKQFRK